MPAARVSFFQRLRRFGIAAPARRLATAYGSWAGTSVAAIAAGAVIRVKPGERVQALVGKSVQGVIEGTISALGNRRLIREMGLATDELDARLEAQESQGRTVTLLATEGHVLAMFAVADTIKAASAEAVKELMDLGVTLVMLTGDNASTAKVIALQAGIADSRGDLLPEDKNAAIKDLQRRFGLTAMVGDGINDAPSLAQSDIGFAMGAAGTHVAMEAADVMKEIKAHVQRRKGVRPGASSQTPVRSAGARMLDVPMDNELVIRHISFGIGVEPAQAHAST